MILIFSGLFLIKIPDHGKTISKNRYTVLHGMHEQHTEKMQLAKAQREIEDRSKNHNERNGKSCQ